VEGKWFAEPIVYSLRFIPSGEYGKPYACNATLSVTDKVGFLSNMHGKMDRHVRASVLDKCRDLGLVEVSCVRHGKWITEELL